MKKSFLILILFLIGISFFEAKAQSCPDGYTYYATEQWNFQFIDPLTNETFVCPIHITYCYKVETDGTINFILKGWEILSSCYQNWSYNNPAFRERALEIMIQNHYSTTVGIQVPCPNHKDIAILKMGSCWTHKFEPNPANGGTIQYFPCGMESYCEYTYEFCNDYNVTPAKVILTPISASAYGDPDCAPGTNSFSGNPCILLCE